MKNHKEICISDKINIHFSVIKCIVTVALGCYNESVVMQDFVLQTEK